MKNLIKKILRERWDWDSLDEAVPVPKGDLKRYIIHSTNVDPRIIYNEGINPVCASDSKEWKNYKYPCVVFAMNGYNEIWAQGQTKGAVVIDTSLLPNHNWWYDPAFYNEKGWSGKIAIITDKKIPAEAIKGILCVRDLGDMRYKFHINTTDEEAQQYLDEVMIKNAEDWSNDCEAKMDYIYNKEMEDITEMKDLIKKILREEIQGEFDFDGIPDNEPISFNKNEIKSKLKQLGTFLYRPEDLGIQSVIDKKIKENGQTIPKSEQVVQKRYAYELKKYGKITDSELRRFLWKLYNEKLFYVDGKWHVVNKMNTNYTVWSMLLTDMFFENDMRDILLAISETNDTNKIKKILMENKGMILNMVDETFDTDDLIELAEEHIKKTDEIGLATEQTAIQWLKDKGMRILKVGGDGDLLDMVFGIDVIAGYKGNIFTIQVKTNEGQAEDFKNDYKRGRYNAIDILMYKDGNGEMIPVKTKSLLKK